MKKFKDLVQSLDEKKKFKLPRGEQEVDSYMEKGAKGKKVPVVIAKKSNKFKVYVDGQELAVYKNEKEARKNAKELIKLLGEDLDDFIEEVLEEPKIEDTLGFSNGLKGNQTYNDVAQKIATIKQEKEMFLISEHQSDEVQLVTEEKNGKKETFIEGVFLQTNLKNRNGRVYPMEIMEKEVNRYNNCLLYTSPSPRDVEESRMPSSA